MENNSTWIDTIVALATPPGVGAIGIIRLSGIKSFDIINKLFPSKDLKLFPSHTLHVGYLRYADKILDEVVISIYKAPNSYTGEDVIELSCHGSAFIQQEILEIIIQNGGRIAKPGEFTQRAFLNGKLDLVQAEAVADLIASDTSASQRAALHNMRGGFSKSLKNLREELIKFSSLIELELDFSEEDVEFADRNKFINLIDHILKETRRLLDSFKHGNVIKNGVNVAIIGKPNAGKSTLLNTFLNEERAIVSEIAGTTRDTIEEIININGILFRLIDTAGIGVKTQDIIENMGIMKSLEKMKQADIILYLFDMGEMDNIELKTIENNFLKENRKFILVGNKDDIIDVNEKKNNSLSGNIIYISAKKNKGIEALKQKIFTAVSGNEILTENIILTNARHYSSLQSLKNFLDDIKEGLSNKIPADLLAIDIRSCMYYLGEITGQITNEDQLDFIFSKFCIGK